MSAKRMLVFVVIIGSIVLSACSGGAASAPTTAPVATEAVAEQPTEAAEELVPVDESGLPEVDPGALTGDIYTAGSSTVGPLTEAVIEQFIMEGFSGQIKNDIIGSGAGFERFCVSGETDVANASRAIKTSEVDSCAQLTPARTPVEFRVGTDAIAVVVSKDNTFATDITLEELAMLFTTAEKWSDVRADWPAEPIQRFTPGTDSGTFDFFVEVVIQKPQKLEKLEDAKALVLSATNLQTSEDDNVLVQGVEGSPYAIGYFGFAYYQEQAANLHALSIDGVAPSGETAESGDYVLARPLFIYSDAEIMKAKPQVAAFINYYLTYVNDLIGEVGYFPASAEALNQAKQAWLDAMQ
ncbi:MAG TPA: PstS family phosphate ABC transporter substrate-binding protein [Anaerolineaceae bacterium]|nr:PstS family phosphate ABC transporter substrate-binding protein [Anaerolineaceae bacterium]